MKDNEPTIHPEELDRAKREGRPVLLSRLMRYDNVEHDLPIGSLVEVDIEQYQTRTCGSEVNLKGRCKLVVVGHTRDCDGEPLYELCDIPVRFPDNGVSLLADRQYHAIKAIASYISSGGGYGRSSLTPLNKIVKVYDNVGQYLFGDD